MSRRSSVGRMRRGNDGLRDSRRTDFVRDAPYGPLLGQDYASSFDFRRTERRIALCYVRCTIGNTHSPDFGPASIQSSYETLGKHQVVCQRDSHRNSVWTTWSRKASQVAARSARPETAFNGVGRITPDKSLATGDYGIMARGHTKPYADFPLSRGRILLDGAVQT